MKAHYEFSKGKRGAVLPPEPGKQRITIRLDNEILNWFRSRVEGGGNYQRLINDALRQHINESDLTATLRKIVREELKRATSS